MIRMKYETVLPLRSRLFSVLTATAKVEAPTPTTIVLVVGPGLVVVVVVVEVLAPVAAVTLMKTLVVFDTLAAEPMRRIVYVPTATLAPTLIRNSAPEDVGLGESVALAPSGIPVAMKVTARGVEGAFVATITTNEADEPAATDWAGVGTRTSKSKAGAVVVVVVLVVGSVAWVGAAVATVGSACVVDGIVDGVVAVVPTARRLVVVVRTTRFLVVVVTFLALDDDDVAAVASDVSVDDSDTATRPTIAVIAVAANRVSFRSRTDGGLGVRRNMQQLSPFPAAEARTIVSRHNKVLRRPSSLKRKCVACRGRILDCGSARRHGLLPEEALVTEPAGPTNPLRKAKEGSRSSPPFTGCTTHRR